MTHLRRAGCLAVTTEVAGPIGRYRVDVAGYADRPAANAATINGSSASRRGPGRVPPRVIVIECKQTRADFLRDRQSRDDLLRAREDLDRLRTAIEEHQIKQWEPELRQNDSALFPELEQWDFHASQLPSYRDICRRLRLLDRQLHGETKFHLMAHYRLADELYIAAPRDLIRPAELPIGWGLLECPRSALDDANQHAELPDLTVRHPARTNVTRPDWRTRWLRNIAVASCVRAARSSRRG
ncbi:MAG: hypothetical protein KC983_01100 [Phycisphaerales bacterium]|nr:hypothetical protein [Phycisphaerales bacterium]